MEKNKIIATIIFLILVSTITFVIVTQEEEGIGFYENDINITGNLSLKDNMVIFKEPLIFFSEDFELIGETDREKRIYIFGVLFGVYSFSDVHTSTQITMILNNVTRVYTIDNFPLEDDCLNKNKTRCFVKWEEDHA